MFDISELGTSVLHLDASSSSSLRPRTLPVHQSSHMTKSQPAPKLQVRPTSNMKINVLIDHPEIILIENPTVEDSRVLVLKAGIHFNMFVTPDVTNMDLSCRDIQMFLSTYLNWTNELKPLLVPVTIGLHASTPFGKKQKMAITIGEIILTISPVAVQTIMGVLAGMGQADEPAVKVC